MKKHFRRNRNVLAPDQRVRTIADDIADYLVGIGFTDYAVTKDHRVFRKAISQESANALYFFVNGPSVRIYQGIRRRKQTQAGPKIEIRGRRLHKCTAPQLEETMGLLAERNYL